MVESELIYETENWYLDVEGKRKLNTREMDYLRWRHSTNYEGIIEIKEIRSGLDMLFVWVIEESLIECGNSNYQVILT